MILVELIKQLDASEADVLALLRDRKLDPEDVTPQMIGPLKRALSPAPLDRANSSKPVKAIAPATPTSKDVGAIAGVGEGAKVSASAAQVRDRRNSATTTVLSNASNQVSEVLEEAAAKAQQMLADKRAETVDRLARQMAATAEGEIDSVMDFLGQFMVGTGTMAIADFQGLLTVEAEVVS